MVKKLHTLVWFCGLPFYLVISIASLIVIQRFMDFVPTFPPWIKALAFLMPLPIIPMITLTNNQRRKNGVENFGIIDALGIKTVREEDTRAYREAAYPLIPQDNISKECRDLVVGKTDSGKYIIIPIKADGVNIFASGAPGSGKSQMLKCWLGSNLYMEKGKWNYFLIDVDGLNYKEVYMIRGRYIAEDAEDLHVIEPSNRYSFGYDVFYRIRDDDDTTVRLKTVTDISEALIEASGDNPYFYVNARKILSGILFWGITKDMGFIEIIHKMMRTPLGELLELIVKDAESLGEVIVVDKLKGFVGKADNESIEDIESTLKQYLDVFSYPDIVFALDANPYKTSPAVLNDGKTSLVLSIETAMLSVYSPIFRLITMQVLRHCESDFKVSDTRNTCILVDEAARIGKIDGLADLMATARKYHTTIAVFYQDLAQFRTIYKQDLAATIQNLCEVKIFLSGSGDKATTDYLAEIVGEYTDESRNYQKKALLTEGKSDLKYSEDRRKVINGKTLMSLREKDEMIMIYFGHYMRFKKIKFFNDPVLKPIFEKIREYNDKHKEESA